MKVFRKFIKAAAFVLAFLVLFGAVSGVLVCPNDYRNYQWVGAFYENEKNRLVLTVFAKDIIDYKEEQEENVSNEVVLNGYVCKKPIYRKTPFGREISDILLAVNRAYNKSDYIPCIAWGRNARFCENMEVGTEVKIVGRVQSRTYEKKFEDGRTEQRVAYEVSIGSLEVINKDENSNQNQEAEAI